jgi:hypothetical protein
MLILSGETIRARDTAISLGRGVVDAGGLVIGPRVAFALRNPDLYVAGSRVNMVSSADALAEQVEGLSAEDVASLEFFPEFFVSPDRIGWWLTHTSPPGEDAQAVVSRMRAFARSLVDRVPAMPDTAVAVTHSPLVRAMGVELFGNDIGEPAWVSGLLIQLDGHRQISAATVWPGQSGL